ncbi:MAG: DNA primase [Acidimicrobiia bacterium]|nr:DNA primase [Acidimicrobiia bacterium]
MAYPREEIDRVRDSTDLAELAAEVTKVKRSGRSVMAVCPFHQEKTPSLSIDPSRGLWHCFGCGKQGDVFNWIQETHTTDFVGALELLARRAGVTLTEDPKAAQQRSQREELVAATALAVEFYKERLKTGADAGPARAYLRGRDYDGAVVDRFEMGYSPAAWDELSRHLREKGVKDSIMQTAGLASRSSRGTMVDRFRNRIMFPIFDLRGDPVGFGARLLEGDGPKYLNSPETPIYKKSRLLYGLNWSKSEMVRSHRAVVVEGYTDVIALHLAGSPVAVATCGTALGTEHLDLLRRFTETVILAFDADEAGAGAALRGFEMSVPGDLDLRVAFLPEGKDPAELVTAGAMDSLTKALDDAYPLIQFRIERELERFDLSEPEGRGRAVKAAAAVVSQHPDVVVRHEYAVFVSRRTGVDLDVVLRSLDGRASGGNQEQSRPAPPARLSGAAKAEQELLRLLLANDAELRDMEVSADLFSVAEHRTGYEVLAPAIAALAPGEPPNLGSLLREVQEPVGPMLRALAMADRPLPDAKDLVIKLKEGALERRIEDIRHALDDVEPGTETYSARFTELIALEQQRRQIRSGE